LISQFNCAYISLFQWFRQLWFILSEIVSFLLKEIFEISASFDALILELARQEISQTFFLIV